MNIYRITFLNNAPISCCEVAERQLQQDYHYEHANGQLIYAIVKAQDEEQAFTISRQLVKEYEKKLEAK